MAWHGVAQHGMAWHGMARLGMAWHGMARQGMQWQRVCALGKRGAALGPSWAQLKPTPFSHALRLQNPTPPRLRVPPSHRHPPTLAVREPDHHHAGKRVPRSRCRGGRGAGRGDPLGVVHQWCGQGLDEGERGGAVARSSGGQPPGVNVNLMGLTTPPMASFLRRFGGVIVLYPMGGNT